MAGEVPTYPKRPSHFAHKAVRAMVKTCVAQEHGQGVFALLCVIAHTEDARHYTSPVTFWNEQLSLVAGFANIKAMDRQRAKAVESGWLVYLPGRKATPGKYWVQIPPQFAELDDAPTDEGPTGMEDFVSPLSTSNLTNKVGRQPGDNREESGETTGRQPGDKWATFNPIPFPNPVPKENPLPPEGEIVEKPAKAIRKAAITTLDGIALPASLDTPQSRDLLATWLKYRVEIGKPYKSTSAILSLLASWAKSPELLAEAIRTSMANQWQGLFVPDQGRRSRAGPLPAGPGLLFPEDRKTGTGEF